jgi:hypothetical protein
MDFQTESAIFQIFGEPLGKSAAVEQQQQALAKAERTEQDFFERTEFERQTGRRTPPAAPISTRSVLRTIGIEVENEPAPAARTERQYFTKRSSPDVVEAQNRFLAAVDRFVDKARKEVSL